MKNRFLLIEFKSALFGKKEIKDGRIITDESNTFERSCFKRLLIDL
jgi:hypothetical protein